MRSPDEGGSGSRSRGADQVFNALSDPTRRSIVELLVAGGPSTATALASNLAISRQAASKHLHLLDATGLARPERVGRETRYTIDPEPLGAVTTWVTDIEQQWSARLRLLAATFEQPGSDRPDPDDPPDSEQP